MAHWKIIVGDLGVRDVGDDEDRARREYATYQQASESGSWGSAYEGLKVTLTCDGAPVEVSPLDVAVMAMPNGKREQFLIALTRLLWPTGRERDEDWDPVDDPQAVVNLMRDFGLHPDVVNNREKS